MLKMAFIYPGQGSQTIGMGVTVAEHFPEAASVFDCASDIAGYDLLSLCAEGPLEKLSRTLYTQPAMYTVEAAITDVLKARGVQPDCAAGHSLGEFSAWYAAGVYCFEDGFRIVSERGRIMDNAGSHGRVAMSAVIGLSFDVVENVCDSIDGTVVVANINSPFQMVISGEKSAVETAGIMLKEKGAKRVLPLKVSGAFHSPLMKKTCAEFAGTIESIRFSDANIPVYCNVSGEPIADIEMIYNTMLLQLTSSVRWSETIENMVHDGVSEALEIGPGNVLAGLIRRIDGTLTVSTASDFSSIMGILGEKA